MINPLLQQTMLENGGYVTAKQVQSLGLSRTRISQYIKAGELLRAAHGIYILPDTVEDDMYTLMLRSEKLIFSHESALLLNKLSDRTTFIHSLTYPSNASIPKSIQAECACYYVKPELHPMGRIQTQTTFGHRVNCYNAERTVCDLLRSRARIDEETVLSAVRNYAAAKNKDLFLLAEYSSRLGVSGILRKYLEVLL